MAVDSARGKLLLDYGRVKVFEGFPFKHYVVSPPDFSERELDLALKLQRIIAKNASLSILEKNPLIKSKSFFDELSISVLHSLNFSDLSSKLPTKKVFSELKGALAGVLSSVKTEKPEELAVFVLDGSVGNSFLSVPLSDENLEEVMVNGFDKSVFGFHRRLGHCKTNIVVDPAELLALIQRIANTVGRKFDASEPLLDAAMPDGNRANATFSYVTPNGHTLTVRKFTRLPLSVIDLIEKKTVSSDLAAFLWVMVEGMSIEPKNIIVTGGSGSGKTTLMNILAGFIPLNHRVISIEDTLELDLLGRENWIQMESKPRIGNVPEVTMNDLLKNTLRMRPDRIIVGEVRSEEAQTLFTAMDTGHSGILGTVHSNSARECLVRLETKPMDVPETMLPLLDIIIVMQRVYDKSKGLSRFIKHVSEVARMDEKTLLSNIFEFDQKTQTIARTAVPSHLMDDFSEKTGLTKNELKREILVRQRILEWMVEKGVRKSSDVESIVQLYYSDPRSVLEKVSQGISLK